MLVIVLIFIFDSLVMNHRTKWCHIYGITKSFFPHSSMNFKTIIIEAGCYASILNVLFCSYNNLEIFGFVLECHSEVRSVLGGVATVLLSYWLC